MFISAVKLGVLTGALTGADLLLDQASNSSFWHSSTTKVSYDKEPSTTKAQYIEGPIQQMSTITNVGYDKVTV